jgi:6-phosphogluconolactonase
MKASLKCISAALVVLFGFALLTARAHAEEEGGKSYVYTNNDPGAAPNSVSAFSVLPAPSYGMLAPVAGSPFATGGTGNGGGFYASHRNTVRVNRNILYAANDGSNNISVFSIDTTTGSLTAVGSPIATGGSGASGISLAVTPNGRFLYAGNFDSGNISVFHIGSNGSLTPFGSPVPVGDSPDGIKVSPDGKFLAVAAFFTNSVAMFSINASTGALTSAGSFPQGGAGTYAADVEINCKSKLLFAPHANFGSTTVSVARIASTGALTPIAGSPFTFASGSNSNVGVLSPDNQHLYVSNQTSNTITSLDVASGSSPPAGTLTLETDSPSGPSPFANPGGNQPSGIGTNRKGDLLYAANFNEMVTGFHIDSDGGLTPVTGSPFSTGIPGFGLLSLTVFPAHENEGRGDEEDSWGRKGHYDFEADRACTDSGEMHYKDDGGHEMNGKVSAVSATGNTATISGTGTLVDGTQVTYTAVVLGNMPVIGANHFAISWITPTGSLFQTSGTLTNGYIAVHPY